MNSVLLIGLGTLEAEGIEEFRQLTNVLRERLAVPIEPCFIELSDPPLIDGIHACLRHDAEQIIALPFLLGVPTHEEVVITAMLEWATATYPQVQFRYAAPLGAQPALIAALAERAAVAAAEHGAHIPNEETAILLVGHGDPDEPENNGETARMARLLHEDRPYGWVEYAFAGLSMPNLAAGIERCSRLGARRVIVLPYLLIYDRMCRFIGEQVHMLQQRYPEMPIVVGAHLAIHPGVIDAVQQRYADILASTAVQVCDLCQSRQRTNQFGDGQAPPRRVSHDHGLKSGRMILPPRYQGGAAVSAAPMSAVELIYDSEGRVAWDTMWGMDDPDSPFCELALAGGPPHRGELLEPVTPESVDADWEGYTWVTMELIRGISMTTGLNCVMSRAIGWIGVQCDSDEMAIWLLRAIVVENVSVRREGSILFLPAGPQFRLEHEIKNVITTLAKTHHYWEEHLLSL